MAEMGDVNFFLALLLACLLADEHCKGQVSVDWRAGERIWAFSPVSFTGSDSGFCPPSLISGNYTTSSCPFC